MAVINKLRNSGIVVIVIIFALAAFIIGDLISNYNRQGGAIEDNSVGSINGEPIQTGEFDALVKEYEYNLVQQNQGKPLEEAQVTQIRNQAWDKIFTDKVLIPEYESLGLEVTQDEMNEWMFGAEPHATIKYFFGPLFKEGEEYDNIKVKSAVGQMMQNPEAKAQVDQVYKAVKGDVLDQKYYAMVKNSLYSTTLEAETEIAKRSEIYNGKLVSLVSTDINQDSILVTDAELEEYLAKNKEDFKQEKSVDFEYVKWDISPSSQDTLTALNAITKAYEGLKNASNDSVYLDINSAKGYDTAFTTPSNLPNALSRNLSKLNVGDMYGPDFDNGAYSVYKILGTEEDSNTYMNTSHILFKTGPGKKEEDIKEKADALLAQIRKGAVTWSNAVKQSEDLGSAIDEGYIGWFTDDGQLVKEFVDFAKGKNKGEIGIAKSQFGFHIIKINESPTNRMVKFGEVSQSIEAGRETRKKVLDVATKFRRSLQGKEDNIFQVMAEKNQLFPSIAREIEEKSKRVSGLADSKNITDWAFESERNEGEISPVLSIGNTQFVVHLTNIRNEGYAQLDDVRDAVASAVKKEKSLDLLENKMQKALEGVNSIEKVAINLKTIAQDFDGYSLEQGNIAGTNDNILKGFFSSTAVKTMAGPIRGTQGVYAFIITEKTVSNDEKIEDAKKNLSQEPKMSAKQWTKSTLKKILDVKDTRYKFYN